MVEYIAKNLAIELMHQSSYLSDGDLLEVNGNLAKARIEAEPAADVVEVIRCRDCIYQKPDTIYGGIWCWAHREPFMLKTLDGFCSHGERREE